MCVFEYKCVCVFMNRLGASGQLTKPPRVAGDSYA